MKGGNLEKAVQATGPGAKVPKVQLANPDIDSITTTNKKFKPKAKQVFARSIMDEGPTARLPPTATVTSS